MKQGMSLQGLIEELQIRQEAKVDYIAPSPTLELQRGNELVMHTDNGPEGFKVSELAHKQIGARLEIPAKYYQKMRDSDEDLLMENVNHWLEHRSENRMLRTMNSRLTAFLSDRYKRIENEEIAETVLPVLLDQDGVEIASCCITDTRMYIKAVFTKLEAEVKVGDVVQSGVTISNSEVGLGSAKISPFINRLVCMNGLEINDMKFAAKHIGARADSSESVYELLTDETKQADDRAILLKCRDVVSASFDEVRFQETVRKMRDSTQEYIESPVEAVKVLTKKASLTEFESNKVLKHLIEGADLSRYGLMNAVTRTSQDIESYDRATEFEQLGGNVLMMPQKDFNEIRLAA